MKYTPLNEIGSALLTGSNGFNVFTARGNNYPASELGISKSELLYEKDDNVILFGRYEDNEVTYPLIDPDKEDFIVVENTSFRFIINDIGSGNKYISDGLYNDLVSAYSELNPWFNSKTVPNVNLDITYLTDYNLVNKFKITELYSEVDVTSTLDTDIRVCEYIDWLVKRPTSGSTSDEIANIVELNPIDTLGTWEYIPDGNLGLDYKVVYDSMIQKKDPDPELVGDTVLKQSYDLIQYHQS